MAIRVKGKLVSGWFKPHRQNGNTGNACIEIEPEELARQLTPDLTKIKEGDEVWVKLEDIKIKATTDGAVIEGSGFRIHEPNIIAHFPHSKVKEENKMIEFSQEVENYLDNFKDREDCSFVTYDVQRIREAIVGIAERVFGYDKLGKPHSEVCSCKEPQSSMNIFAKKGDKVIFAYPTAGYPHEQELAKKYLKLNKVYMVEKTEVRDWHTNVYLKEHCGVAFNSVLFSDYNPTPQIEPLKYEELATCDYGDTDKIIDYILILAKKINTLINQRGKENR